VARFRTRACLSVRPVSRIVTAALLVTVCVPNPIRAQSTPPDGKEQEEDKSTGLPHAIHWTFNLDAGWAAFGFGNSFFNNPREGVAENLSDQWFEGYVRPALSGVFKLRSTSELYGRINAVGERTYGSSPVQIGRDVSSFGPDDAFIGWRSGQAIGSSDNLFDFRVGRAPYRLGHGMLVSDGSSNGGSRGGYWTGDRKAFEVAAIGRVKPGPHLIELFYLNKDELPEAETGTRLWGLNYEWSIAEKSTIGASYLKFSANRDVRADRDGLNVLNVRAYVSPIVPLPDLSFEFEYASERNGQLRDSNAWTLKSAYKLNAVTWASTLSYRYAFFQGDNPATTADEGFDQLLPSFYEWGSWWQGEIAGEYFLPNSNLISHQIRAHVEPNEHVSAGLIVYKFLLDQPQVLGHVLTDKNVAVEADLYVDWKVNSTITISVVPAFANPGAAVQQYSGRTKNFVYGMLLIGYSF
jgi:Alginate export